MNSTALTVSFINYLNKSATLVKQITEHLHFSIRKMSLTCIDICKGSHKLKVFFHQSGLVHHRRPLC